MGKSVTDYINMLRINRIKQLLINTKKTIKEIVNETGYIDVSSFTRKFKKIEGITPGKYRILNCVDKNA
jgi:two-component system, response regulator YesN